MRAELGVVFVLPGDDGQADGAEETDGPVDVFLDDGEINAPKDDS